jgi:hypothetical protein
VRDACPGPPAHVWPRQCCRTPSTSSANRTRVHAQSSGRPPEISCSIVDYSDCMPRWRFGVRIALLFICLGRRIFTNLQPLLEARSCEPFVMIRSSKQMESKKETSSRNPLESRRSDLVPRQRRGFCWPTLNRLMASIPTRRRSSSLKQYRSHRLPSSHGLI